MTIMAEQPAKRPRLSPTVSHTGLDALDTESVNTVRCLAADMVQRANSGHPGAPMGCAPVACALFGRIMKFSPADPKWLNRDRFVLSNGHACALQYAMLHLTGYDVSLEDLKQFRQLHSKTPGHPESFATPGVEVCTGPLGQGITNAVGMAIAQSHLEDRFNKPGFAIFDNYTYVLCGDGCLMEGIASEAASMAGHLALNKLIVFYDDNKISIDGSTDLAFTEDVGMRFQSYGWNVLTLETGNAESSDQFVACVAVAKTSTKPTLIKMKTTIGFGSAKEGSEKTHGAPLGASDIAEVKKKFGLDPQSDFQISSAVKSRFMSHGEKGNKQFADWKILVEDYCSAHPVLGAELKRRMEEKLAPGWKECLPKYTTSSKAAATRVYSGECLAALVKHCPEFIGGCADLAPSCNTKHVEDFQKSNRSGRYLRFGVREHAMAAICNGMVSYGCVIPYCATFMVFWGYAWGAARLSALSRFPVLYVGTHDSIDLGEDGPTHQPVEVVQLLRATPNFLCIRPADGEEVAGAYSAFMENRSRPTCIVLSRSGAPHLEGTSRDKVSCGAYVLTEDPGFTVILAGSGQEVDLCVKAKLILNKNGVKVRVVSFPSWELFAEQTDSYRSSVYPKGIFRVYVESCSTKFGLCEHADLAICMDGFGASAPGGKNKETFGFTPESVAAKTMKAIGKQ